MDFIPYGKQQLDQGDIDAVVDVLNSDYLTTGPNVKAFEDAISEYCDVKYTIAVANLEKGAAVNLGVFE